MGYAIVAIFAFALGFGVGIALCVVSDREWKSEEEKWSDLISDTKKNSKVKKEK